MDGLQEAQRHARRRILLSGSLWSCPLDSHTQASPLLSLSGRIFLPSFQFSHLFSITEGPLIGPPQPRVHRTARLGDKTPLTPLHYEAVIGGASHSLSQTHTVWMSYMLQIHTGNQNATNSAFIPLFLIGFLQKWPVSASASAFASVSASLPAVIGRIFHCAAAELGPILLHFW